MRPGGAWFSYAPMTVDIPISEMSFPTRMVVGPGALARLPHEMEKLGTKRALIVADKGIKSAGLVEKVEKVIAEGGLAGAVYLGVSKNPIERDVLEGVETLRRVEADVVIGLGGGAPMDVAKTIALKATHELPLIEYDDLIGGDRKIHGNMPPVIAIPTTAGTGSEVGRASVICLGDDGHKVVIFSPHMLPNVAICDAELTVGLPPHITAATGMDALTHALEAYVSNGNHPFADMFALGALTRVGRYLVRAVRDGEDIKARHEMLVASSMAAISFQKGLGACHALAHPLSAVADLHHGLANAIMLPHVIEYNLDAASEAYAIAGQALGDNVSGTLALRARSCFNMVWSILEAIGSPRRLAPLGVKKKMIPTMVEQAVIDAAAAGNPKKLTPEAAKDLYERAM